ncbi:MAG: histidine kinase dimerization/phospho-acceptor domain-containing protein [Candidatus Sericytochromatia bacterium]
MADPQAWIAYLQGNEFLPLLRFGRDGSLLGATPNAIALLEAPPWPGQDLAHTLMLGPEGKALLATEGVWRGAGSLLRGERLPVSVRLEAYGAGSEVIVLLSVEGEGLMRLQEDISEVNNELASLTRERAKQSQRLSRALSDVEAKRAQIEAQHQLLEENTFELEQMVLELDEANRKLTEMDAIKTRFYANMNHELRTPLNSIIGFAEDALDGLAGPLTPDLEQYFKTIEASGKRQLALINDLLDFAKLQAGKVAIEPVAIAPRAIAGELASTLRPLLGRKRQPSCSTCPTISRRSMPIMRSSSRSS